MENLKNVSRAGTVLTAGSNFAEGAFERDMARASAAAYGRMGQNAVGAAQRDASGIRKQTAQAQSRARAIAAASGGTSTDAGVVDIMSDLGEQGEYNAMAALYEGQEAKHQLDYRAALTKAAGKAAFRAGLLKGGTSILAGTQSLYEKYGSPAMDQK